MKKLLTLGLLMATAAFAGTTLAGGAGLQHREPQKVLDCLEQQRRKRLARGGT